MSTKRAVIFANGQLSNPNAVRQVLHAGDYLVAADGGLHHLQRLGRSPDLLVGDLDSTSLEEISLLENSGVKVLRYPVEKNETDLELALRAVLETGYKTVRIVGGLGGRLDHLLGNVFLLTSPQSRECDIRLDDGDIEVFVIFRSVKIEGQSGDTVSLLPLAGPAHRVVTDGLQYPLHSETLWDYQTRGISNVMTGDTAAVSLREGCLLCVHQRQVDTFNSTGG